MINNLIWNFPKSGHGTLSSSDNNNIDTFADDRLGNLVREILQNSLDAAVGKEPVTVEFRTFKRKTSDFPGIDSFKHYLLSWIDNHQETPEDDKDYIFVKKALSEFEKEEMTWLRISDFNTTGLYGSTSSSPKTPYFSFIHGSGKNSKQNANAGGSKGVGKNAIFANSVIQTLFVSTLTKDNEKSFIGVSFLVSSDENDINKDWTQGIGFCVQNNEYTLMNKPYLDINNIDASFSREKRGVGTDIYIPSFIIEDDWVKQISGQVIYSFMPALLRKMLNVKIIDGLSELGMTVDMDINGYNLPTIINQSSSYRNAHQKNYMY